MTENLLAKKLRIKEGQHILILHAPEDFLDSLQPLPPHCTISNWFDKSESYQLVLLFVMNKAGLHKYGADAIAAMNKEPILWIAYPKSSSKIKSDLTRDEGWAFLDPYHLAGMSSISINDTWSALRFKYDEDGISHGQRMAEMKLRSKDPQSRVIVVPKDFELALGLHPKAKEVFDKFAFSHRKEYVVWIESAKKTETRNNRIEKAIEKLLAGSKYNQ